MNTDWGSYWVVFGVCRHILYATIELGKWPPHLLCDRYGCEGGYRQLSWTAIKFENIPQLDTSIVQTTPVIAIDPFVLIIAIRFGIPWIDAYCSIQ